MAAMHSYGPLGAAERKLDRIALDLADAKLKLLRMRTGMRRCAESDAATLELEIAELAEMHERQQQAVERLRAELAELPPLPPPDATGAAASAMSHLTLRASQL